MGVEAYFREARLCEPHGCTDARSRMADGKTLLHCLLAEPPLIAAELQHCVRHSPDWRKGSDTTNKTGFRGATLALLEERIEPFVTKALSIAPALASIADHAGTTPLHLAAREGLEAMCKLLLDAHSNVDVNARDESGTCKKIKSGTPNFPHSTRQRICSRIPRDCVALSLLRCHLPSKAP